MKKIIEFWRAYPRRIIIFLSFIALVAIRRLEVWPFLEPGASVEGSSDIIKLIFSDTTAIGIFRLVIVGSGFYIVLSMISQILRDRWISGFTVKGMQIDDVFESVEKAQEEVDAQIDEVISERDEALLENIELRSHIRCLMESKGQLEELLNNVVEQDAAARRGEPEGEPGVPAPK